ncbi:hypothetical protein TCE0_023r07248 [Talaromyces pinophilus]|uniref:Heterokaryon incompatibility domain-containing protein n=1 Tax=Talaromyces pinophilus TaxID=128442 RepID=A0A0B8MXU2_TALPI|nr:hypothetical protein TCE0_023r07248 [Talaromyces pinophilus]
MSTFEERLAYFLLNSSPNAQPPCDHAPVSCVPDPSNASICLVGQLHSRWTSEPRPFHPAEHPLVYSIWQAGYDRHKAQYLASDPGYGITRAPELVKALKKIGADERLLPLPSKHDKEDVIHVGGIKACKQCKPGTNTWSYCAPYNIRYSDCHRIIMNYNIKPGPQDGGKVCCLGRNGATKYCGPNEFMAISHVWSHGWQGSAEDGICCRVLDMLLDIAATKLNVQWIWLDIAMISRDKSIRPMAINSMDTVYSTAKATLVVDRLLLNFTPKAEDDKQTALAITASDWMTRLWTMQEAMLSRNLLILTHRDSEPINPRDLLERIILAKHDTTRWQQYAAIKLLSAMTHDPKPSLRKIVTFSYERTTTNPIDMVRALYPLFGLKWPAADTTLVQGQILLLKHLGQEAAILTSLSSPIGLPSPWGWAPLVIPGAAGGSLAGHGRYVSEDGLMGAWSWLEVVPVAMQPRDAVKGRLSSNRGWMYDFKRSFRDSRKYREQPEQTTGGGTMMDYMNHALGIGADILKSSIITTFASWSGPPTQDLELSKLVGMKHVFAVFRAANNPNEQFKALLTYTANDPWPWQNQRLFFIASVDRSAQTRDAALKPYETAQYFDLVVVESEQSGWCVMRRVGKVITGGVRLKGGKEEGIQGVLR